MRRPCHSRSANPNGRCSHFDAIRSVRHAAPGDITLPEEAEEIDADPVAEAVARQQRLLLRAGNALDLRIGGDRAVALCEGTPSDNIQGILILAAVWGIVATEGDVKVACGTNSISAGRYVRTAAGGMVTAASGANDVTSRVIGYALATSSSGMVPVRLQGVR
jgi:hypothetical protein